VIDQPNQLMKIYYNGAEAPLHFASDEGRLQANFRYDFKTSGPFLVGTFPGNSYPFKGHRMTCGYTTACCPTMRSRRSRRKNRKPNALLPGTLSWVSG